ncbi:MAG: PLP-dependent aminotransferase family protein [Maioricimonas sp. JB049]
MNMTPLDVRSGENLYEAVADRVAWLIENGTLCPGDRIPSVRRMREQLEVSISTVMQAYRLLEDRGLVEARPQSGYYVRRGADRRPDEPTVARPASSPRKVSICSLSYSLMDKLDHAGVVKLGAAVPDVELMPVKALNRCFGQVLRYNTVNAHGYDTPAGCDALRSEIARRMLDAGVTVSADEIVTTCGTTEGLYLALRAVTRPGDTVAVETPTYYGVLDKLEELQLRSLELRTDPRDGPDVDSLAEAVSAGKVQALLTVSNFSNPLGCCIPDDRKRAIMRIMSRAGLPVIEDDIFGELYFDGTRPKTLKAYDQEGLVLYCSSFSKTLSPGSRAGWCIPGKFAEQFLRTKMAVSPVCPMVTQLAIAAYLKQGGFDRHLRRLRRCYRDQVHRVAQAVGRHFPEGTRVSNPAGGYVLWVEMPDGVDSLKLHDEAAEHGISIAPGPLFSPVGNYRNCLRLNCGIQWSPRVEAAVATVGTLARRQLSTAASGGT